MIVGSNMLHGIFKGALKLWCAKIEGYSLSPRQIIVTKNRNMILFMKIITVLQFKYGRTVMFLR